MEWRKRKMKLHKWTRLGDIMKEKKLDGVWIQSYENRRYFTHFTGSNGFVYFDGQDATMWTDQRYELQASEQSPDVNLLIADENMFEFLRKSVPDRVKGRIGFENTSMTVSQFDFFREILPEVEWIALEDELLQLRAIKSFEEKEAIRASIQIADDSFSQLVKRITTGMSEIDVKNELEYLMAKGGHEGPAFGTIVAFAERAALPHAVPTNRKIERDHYLLIDFGVLYGGYMSDMTRTIQIGHPQEKHRKVYDVTLKALEKSIESIYIGQNTGDLDQVARSVFESAKLEPFTLRGLGHGVGLQIHEYPRVVQNGEDRIQAGMIFTIEPGVYIENEVGVRIEDIVSVTKEGVEIMTNTPRNIHLDI